MSRPTNLWVFTHAEGDFLVDNDRSKLTPQLRLRFRSAAVNVGTNAKFRVFLTDDEDKRVQESLQIRKQLLAGAFDEPATEPDIDTKEEEPDGSTDS